jgi:hypothetical protein
LEAELGRLRSRLDEAESEAVKTALDSLTPPPLAVLHAQALVIGSAEPIQTGMMLAQPRDMQRRPHRIAIREAAYIAIASLSFFSAFLLPVGAH